jgi:hypothetical protein
MTVAHIDPVVLTQTCEAFPEQYIATRAGRQVGFLRLRGGWFYVACPDGSGTVVYQIRDLGIGNGFFDSDQIRTQQLRNAVEAIERWLTPPLVTITVEVEQ